ncbi:hypothetical protein D3C85_1758350 [compost metagenome]
MLEEASSPISSQGVRAIRLSMPVACGHSPVSSRNRVTQGRVRSMRQPKISSPFKGGNNEV